MPEHVDRDAAAGVPVAADAQPAGVHFGVEALADADGDVFVKAGVVAEGAEEQFELLDSTMVSPGA